MEKTSKIYVAGHRGMVGSAIVRELQRQGYTNLVTRPHKELDLTRQADVETFFAAEKPEYVVIGTRISDIPHDLSRLDSVEVWIKTDGKIEIILETIIESDTNFKATYKTEGNGSWKRYAVRPQDFDTKDTVKYHGWDVTRNRITRFTIFAYDGSSILVDNVRMYGINRDDLK